MAPTAAIPVSKGSFECLDISVHPSVQAKPEWSACEVRRRLRAGGSRRNTKFGVARLNHRVSRTAAYCDITAPRGCCERRDKVGGRMPDGQIDPASDSVAAAQASDREAKRTAPMKKVCEGDQCDRPVQAVQTKDLSFAF